VKEGDVALTPLPQADGLIKNCPVILLVLKLQLPRSGGWEPVELGYIDAKYTANQVFNKANTIF
jgi:hypothetical protein